jgi:sporulation protein YlmC with PRC-barrel domain
MKHFTAIFLLTCASFSAFAQEQQQPAPPITPEQQPVQQLDTTTIQTEQAPQPEIAQPAQSQHIALRVVGSHILGQTGERLGRIEEVLLNRTSGAIEFAVVAPQTPANSPRLVPIPWGALTHTWDQSRAGGPAGANQVFSANLDARRLAQAPSFDRSRTVGVDQVLANAGTFFGQPQATGAASVGGGNLSGVGAAPATGIPQTGAATATGIPQTGTGTTPAPGTAVAPGNNPLVVPGQQASGFPGVSQPGSRIPPPQQRVPHAGANTPGVGGQPQINGNAQQQPQNNGTAAGASGARSSGGQATGGSSSGGATGGSSGSSGGSSSGGSSGGGATGK